MAGIDGSKICVLIPAYNEEKNIARVTAELKALGYPVAVIDDGSTDRTAAEARDAGAHVLVSKDNEGKGAALRKGFEWFLAGSYPAAVMMDADGQHDIAQIRALLAPLINGSADLVVGNRMSDTAGMPRLRSATNRFMSWMISVMADQRIPDSQCGYRAVRREVVEKIRLRTSHFETESEMLLEAARRGFVIGAVPVRSVYEGGHSHISPIKDTLRFISFLIKYYFSALIA